MLRVGGRLTYYGEQEGEGTTLDAVDRGVFNTGAEVSTKTSRLWRGASSRFLDATGLRHILEPSVNYVYVPTRRPRPTNCRQFDYELDSFRLIPVHFPEYNSIDSINSQNAIRFGLRNACRPSGGTGSRTW